MTFLELMTIGIGLAMDAFAVSVCKGLSMKRLTVAKMGKVGFYFGFFQAAMPMLDYFLGVGFKESITSIDHWIAFILLGLIGGNMIKEALGDEQEDCDDDLSFKTMLMLAIATSIDALAIGVTFAFLNVNIYLACAIIGVTTFIISVAGVKIGNVFGLRYKAKAELAGGIILILMGLKILLEHLAIL